MKTSLNDYQKKNDYLICIDSDGCAVDNLEAKHRLCFAPCLIREWRLEAWREEIVGRWMQINVYNMTRGIPRYEALLMILETVDQQYRRVRGLSALKEWVTNAEKLTMDSLAEETNKSGSLCLNKTLRWAKAVNRKCRELPAEHHRFFPGVKEALQQVREFADIAVISSAVTESVVSEWQNAGLEDFADVFLCQESGSKAYSIAQLKKKGYGESRVLMVGDAPGDRASAELNGVWFYPVQTGKESESWNAFPEATEQFRRGEYILLEKQLKEAFIINLLRSAS